MKKKRLMLNLSLVSRDWTMKMAETMNLDFDLITDEEGKNKLKIDAWFGSRKTSAAIKSALSHVENLITGVTKGFRYMMRFVCAHFPINASITNDNKSIEIRNFLERRR
jgi:large subunit ribosomal protein L9e